ncbi:MAG: lipopolysaccharide core heptose(I) kinase RfaP [Pseudomonadota bacterium]
MHTELELPTELERALEAGGQLAEGASKAERFAAVMACEGEVYRAVANRETLALPGLDLFLKRHRGSGWAEILKNALTLRRPVLGAENERAACEALPGLGIATPELAGYGRRGRHPARRESFVLTRAVTGFESLEDRIALPAQTATERHRLLAAIAQLAQRLHGAGWVHRDFYLCHLWVRSTTIAELKPELLLMDLHRARHFDRLPDRYRLRDLAALLYSTFDRTPGRFALLRFVRLYSGRPLRVELNQRGRFWRAVYRRALILQLREDRALRHTVPRVGSVALDAADCERLLASGQRLKDDPPATLVRARYQDRSVVLKRYNLLGPVHRLRQSLRAYSRVARAWRGMHRLKALGLPVAQPLGFFERRRFGLRQPQYLLQEDLGDLTLLDEFEREGLSSEREDELVRLLRRLAQHGIEHGDMKATNLMVTAAGLKLIDLDATRLVLGGSERDRRRLLRNFEADAALCARLARRLPPPL